MHRARLRRSAACKSTQLIPLTPRVVRKEIVAALAEAGAERWRVRVGPDGLSMAFPQMRQLRL